jgi:hypothetical protein
MHPAQQTLYNPLIWNIMSHTVAGSCRTVGEEESSGVSILTHNAAGQLSLNICF